MTRPTRKIKRRRKLLKQGFIQRLIPNIFTEKDYKIQGNPFFFHHGTFLVQFIIQVGREKISSFLFFFFFMER